MMAASSRDWNVFKQIFADHWEPFQQAHPHYQTAYYDSLVAKMLACGNPEKIGSIAYRCQQCGQGKHLVAMSCQSSLCLRCAKVYVDNWVNQVSKVLHEGVIYRHIILTVPAMFRPTFYQNAAVVLNAFMRCGVQCLNAFYSTVRGKPLRGGSITVLHTHGRNGRDPAVGGCVFHEVSQRPGDQRAEGRCPLAVSERSTLRGQVCGEPPDFCP